MRIPDDLIELPANVALMQLVAAAPDLVQLERLLVDGPATLRQAGSPDAAERLSEAARLWRDSPDAWRTMRSILAKAERFDLGSVAGCADLFDAVVAISPEASVALYSLGRPDLLDHATDEIMAWLTHWKLARAGDVVVEVGCGIGRFLAPLCQRGCTVLGLDISFGMLAQARRRCAGLSRALPVRSSGADLACVGKTCVDLVLAVDVFPYLVEAGVARRHVAEAQRVLRPGGTLLVLNWSYRGTAADHRAEVRALAADTGLCLNTAEADGLRAWDGQVFRLVKPGGR